MSPDLTRVVSAGLGHVLPSLLNSALDVLSLFDARSRLYRLEVQDQPSGNLLVEAFQGVEALSALSLTEIVCLCNDPSLDPADLLGTQLRLSTALSDGGNTVRTGYVAAVDTLGDDGSLARYRLLVVPGLWYAQRDSKSRIFQQRSTLDIVEAVLADYAPWVEWQATPDAQDCAAANTPFNQCTQYRETDYAFLRRILADAGLGFRIEEIEDDSDDTLADAARHRMVIFADASQLPEDPSSSSALGGGGLRYHRAAGPEEQDCLTALATQVHALVPGLTAALAWRDGSGNSSASQSTGGGLEQFFPLAADRFADGSQADDRIALIEAAQACERERILSHGNVRTLRPGLNFTVSQYQPLGKPGDAPGYLVWAQAFAGVNNLPGSTDGATWRDALGDLPSHLQRLDLDDDLAWAALRDANAHDNATLLDQAKRQGYAHHSRLHRLALPWRALPLAKPAVPGPLSATVVGDDPIHTDRLGRVKVRFHWQEGETADDTDCCWARAVQRNAGPGRGMQFTPRPGHAVWVGFVDGDIDRPLVIGSQYNGVGEGDANYSPASTSLGEAAAAVDTAVFGMAQDHAPAGQGNLTGGQSPVWHGAAGDDHGHAGALMGFRSQGMDGEGHNQLLFDDSDGQQGVQLATTHQATQLNLGHIIHRADNYRGSERGQGAELRTDGYGALRAARGWLFSSYGIQHANSDHEPAGELVGPLALLKQAQQVSQLLSQTTAKHLGVAAASQIGASLPAKSSIDDTRTPLPAMLHALQGEVDATDPYQAASDAAKKQIAAKPNTAATPGTVPAFTDPLLILAARGGIIGAAREAHFLTGETQSWLSGRHMHWASGTQWRLDADQAVALTGGLAEGDKDGGQGLTAITGEGDLLIQAHAANVQLAAKSEVKLESASADTTLAAAKKIVIQTAGGASITIADGKIEFACPGNLTVHAGQKKFIGGANLDLPLPSLPTSTEMTSLTKFDLKIQDVPGAYGVVPSGEKWRVVITRHFSEGAGVNPLIFHEDDWQEILATGTVPTSGMLKLKQSEQDAIHQAASLHPGRVWLVCGLTAMPLKPALWTSDAPHVVPEKVLDALNFAPDGRAIASGRTEWLSELAKADAEVKSLKPLKGQTDL